MNNISLISTIWHYKIFVLYYRIGELNPIACNKLLGKLSNLESSIPRRSLMKYIQVLKDFDRVRKSCFGLELVPTYQSVIEIFRKSYINLDLPVTNSIHILTEHVPQICEIHGKGLSYYNAR